MLRTSHSLLLEYELDGDWFLLEFQHTQQLDLDVQHKVTKYLSITISKHAYNYSIITSKCCHAHHHDMTVQTFINAAYNLLYDQAGEVYYTHLAFQGTEEIIKSKPYVYLVIYG